MEKVIIKINEVTGDREEITKEAMMILLEQAFTKPERVLENLLGGASVQVASEVYRAV